MPRMTEKEARKQHGCWLEGSRGWTASGLLVRMAGNWGMPLDDDDHAILTAYLDSEESITLPSGEEVDDVTGFVVDQGELADQAEEYLNTEVAPQGWTFGWRDGEFFLLPDHEWHDEEPVEGCPECGCLGKVVVSPHLVETSTPPTRAHAAPIAAAMCENWWINTEGHRQTCDQRATESVLDCGFVTDMCAQCARDLHSPTIVR